MSRPYQSYFTSSGKSGPGSMAYTHSSKDGARKHPPSRGSPASDQTLLGGHVPNGVPWVPEEATQILPADIKLAIEELVSAWNRSQMIKDVKEDLLTPLIPTTKQPTKHVSQAYERNTPGYPEATLGTAAYGAYPNDTADLGRKLSRRGANHSAPHAFPGYSPPIPMFPIAPGYPSTYVCNSPYMNSSNYFNSPAPDEISYSSSPVIKTNATGYTSTTYGGNNPDYNRAAPNFPPVNSPTLQKSYPIPTAGRGSTSSYGQTAHHSRTDKLPSAAPDPYSTTDTTALDSRRKANMKKVPSEDALVDAQKVTGRDHSSFPTNGRRSTPSYDSAAPDLYHTTDSTGRREAKLKKALSVDALVDARKVTERDHSSFHTNGRGSTPSYDQTAYHSGPDELPSTTPDPYSTADTTALDSRRKAKLKKVPLEDALDDGQKDTELDPSSYLRYEAKHAALHEARRYDDAIADSNIPRSKLKASDTKLRQQYSNLSETASAILAVISAHFENAPQRLINTSTGFLCNREEQKNAFKESAEYKQLLSSTMKNTDSHSRKERIEKVVFAYFRYVMLSHKWEEKEPLLRDIQDKNVYESNLVVGIAKLQSFCKTARNAGYLWAWVDTCCIDQLNAVEVQQSVNAMFVWYRHSALTIIYLSDVLPSSKSGALARSIWNQRGWTVQEFLAPKVVLFYHKDWNRYLDDHSPNHKDSHQIMRELGDATGIDGQALISFQPGIQGAREKLRWVSKRETTVPEDVAYSLFGIFSINLPVIYGEMKQNALGRLLQEIVAKSGEISALDWVGKSSDFNSCLPTDTSPYAVPPYMRSPRLSEEKIQESVSSLKHPRTVKFASQLYHNLSDLSAPRFSTQRLFLPCIVFPVTEVKRLGSAPHFQLRQMGFIACRSPRKTSWSNTGHKSPLRSH
ncbi:hypothetical protein K503DRAFT_783398 [Rhizopogon vinicolor AM-OR11-026]|uniref:Heterokaryon incompatibility domain-containing protein n=1 Tax=Rhizopogon vinicolor AM-OR11-026 TaxID=1314800 RepID=A0A1B7MYS5_9AGAM|nr:hypothetical protein K503DRAFT_783398 [Rhizopogon vinicolor AM-OR11-026]